MLVDVHAHIDHPWFEKDLDEVISRAKKAGVKAIITNGIDYNSNRASLELAKKYDIVKVALGIYPIEPLNYEISSENIKLERHKLDVDEEIKFITKNKNKIVAIGEVGLDFNKPEFKENPILKSQKELFQKMIELAEKLKKPIIVHSRKAENEVFEMLQASKLKKVVMHCYNGRHNLAKKIADNGWSFSIPTSITRSSHFQQLVAQTHITHILTETDAPYQSPVVGQRNEPAFITETIKKISEIMKITSEECKNNIFMNYQRMFL